jgi:hypothetical protein
MPRKYYRVAKEIVIPVGERLFSPPTDSTRWGKDYEAIIALGKDHTGYFNVDLKEGIESGFIEEVTDD